MDAAESWGKFLAWLTNRHQEIKASEQKALDLLEQGDTKGYKDNLVARAKLIERMPLDGSSVINALPEDVAQKVRGTLQRFASSASMGLNLGSTFYLSALLYRDDHGVGEPDNLACLLAKMQADGPNFRG